MEELEYCQELQHLIKHAHNMFNIKTSNTENNPQAKTIHKYPCNVLYLDKTEQDNICGLYLFMRKHPELSKQEIKRLINRNNRTFPALQFLIRDINGLIDSLQVSGFKKTCTNAVKDRMLKSAINNLY